MSEEKVKEETPLKVKGTLVKADEEIIAKPVGPLTADERKAGEQRWTERLDAIKKEETATLKCVLVSLWNKGGFVHELLDEPKKYGNHSVENLATELNIGISSLYFYRRFHDAVPLETAIRYSDLHLSWHAVMYLTGVKDEKTRETLIEKYRKEKWSAEKLETEVKKINEDVREKKEKKGEKADKRGANSPLRLTKAVLNSAEDLDTKLDELVKIDKVIFDITDADSLKDTLRARETLRKFLDPLATKMEKVIDMLIEVPEKPLEAKAAKPKK